MYGGSISSYVGGYAWSYSSSGGKSSSQSGPTTAGGVNVSISGVNSSDCSATTTGTNGANSYGGSISAVYIGAYTWSSSGGDSQSDCGSTNVSGLVVSISSSRLVNSSAVSRTFPQCPLVFNVPDLTRVPLAEYPYGSKLPSLGSNVSALGSVPSVSYCLCACDAL